MAGIATPAVNSIAIPNECESEQTRIATSMGRYDPTLTVLTALTSDKAPVGQRLRQIPCQPTHAMTDDSQTLAVTDHVPFLLAILC